MRFGDSFCNRASMGGLTVAERGKAALSLAMSSSTWAGLSITNGSRPGHAAACWICPAFQAQGNSSWMRLAG